MLKKFIFLVFMVFLFGCESYVSSKGGIDDTSMDISETDAFSSAKKLRVGVLLPLSGATSKYGQGLKNATLMALDDIKNNNLILQYYDTKGTPEGARVAVENALNQGSELIVGPLMKDEVRATSQYTSARNIPVIAFSTSQEVLRHNVFTLGLLIDEQVDRIMSYAATEGRHNFALMLPDNDNGIAVARAAVLSARKNGVNITKIAFYPPDTMDFSETVKQMTNYDFMRERNATNKPVNSVSAKVDFDAILIPESGYRLKSAIAMFGYYDIYSPKVKFLGTSVWESTSMNRETAAIGAWYPALSRVHSVYFANKYNELFGEKPNSLFSFAYDAVALAAAINRQHNYSLSEAIVRPEGYVGINGAFRLFENGTNQHSLDIFEVKESGDVAINSAPKRFSAEHDENLGIYSGEGTIMPQIIGKNAETVRSLIYQPRPQPAAPSVEEVIGIHKIRGYWGF